MFLDAHAHTTYIKNADVIKVKPSENSIYDGRFFVEGHPFNQGNMFIFNENDAIEALNEAVRQFESGKEFNKNKDIAKIFSVENTTDILLNGVLGS